MTRTASVDEQKETSTDCQVKRPKLSSTLPESGPVIDIDDDTNSTRISLDPIDDESIDSSPKASESDGTIDECKDTPSKS
jgi:hypothetical protein